MAMNKKEKAYLEELEVKLALHVTKPVQFDVHPPTSLRATDEAPVQGYVQNSFAYSVEEACTSSWRHMIGTKETNSRRWSQGSISMYSSKLLAYKAMRNEVELRYASKLRKLDKLIEDSTEDETA